VQLSERRIKEYKQQLAIPLFAEKEGEFAVVRDNQVAYASESALDEANG